MPEVTVSDELTVRLLFLRDRPAVVPLVTVVDELTIGTSVCLAQHHEDHQHDRGDKSKQ